MTQAPAPTDALGVRPGSILNLGCGRKHEPSAVNLDVTSDTNPDVVHDLNVMPWPFESDRFDVVLMYDVLEHLHDVVAVMEEVHRVCRPGAVVRITVPHFSSANTFTDPTHRHQFSALSFAYFTAEHPLSFYTRKHYRRRRVDILFHPSITNKVVRRLANRWPERYERRWAWMFPAWFIYAELEVSKP